MAASEELGKEIVEGGPVVRIYPGLPPPADVIILVTLEGEETKALRYVQAEGERPRLIRYGPIDEVG